MEPLQLSCGRPTVTRYEVQFCHSSLPSRTTIDHRRLGRVSSSNKVAIVQEDTTEGKDFVYVAEMDHVIWRTCKSHKRPAMVNPSSQNDAEIIGVKNQSIIA
jgi:hypothetical protein